MIERIPAPFLSRRRALAGLSAAIPLAAMEATAAAPTGLAAESPQLAALAARFDPVHAEWLRLTGDDLRSFIAREAPAPDARSANEGQLDRKPVDWDSLTRATFPLVDQIIAQRPSTVAGLAVVARAMLVIFYDLWTDPNDSDPDAGRLRNFITAVCGFAGVPIEPFEMFECTELARSRAS